MTSTSENGNGRTQSQLSELRAPEDLVKIQCSSCGEVWFINKRVAERQSVPLCYDCERVERDLKVSSQFSCALRAGYHRR